MSVKHEVQVREKRRLGFFQIDNEIIDDYGERIGHYGIAVYAALARYSREESATVGLTKMAQKLRIGRAKLLEVIDLLEEVGLISVDVGDRKTTSVYTLLHIEKGGSNGNHPDGVGSSNQNQGGSDQNQEGGSNQNPYKTMGNKTNTKESARAKNNVSYILSSEGQVAVDVLRAIDSWDKSHKETKDLVGTTIEMFPDIDVSLTAKNLAYKIRTKTCKQYKKPSQAFANWASADAQRATSTPEPSPQRRDSQTTRSKPVEVDYEKMEPAYTEIDRRRAEMRAEIIRRAEEEEKAKGVMSGE